MNTCLDSVFGRMESIRRNGRKISFEDCWEEIYSLNAMHVSIGYWTNSPRLILSRKASPTLVAKFLDDVFTGREKNEVLAIKNTKISEYREFHSVILCQPYSYGWRLALI